jgi:hypothetical protein
VPTLGLDKLAPPGKQSAVDPTPACLLCSLPLSLERLQQLQLLVAAWSQRYPRLDLSLQQAPLSSSTPSSTSTARQIHCVTPSQKYHNDRLLGYSLVCKCFTSPYPRVAVHTRVIPPQGPKDPKGLQQEIEDRSQTLRTASRTQDHEANPSRTPLVDARCYSPPSVQVLSPRDPVACVVACPES